VREKAEVQGQEKVLTLALLEAAREVEMADTL